MKALTGKLFRILIIVILCLAVRFSLDSWYQRAYEDYPDKEKIEKSAVDELPWYEIVIVTPIKEECVFRGSILLIFLLFSKGLSSKRRNLLALILITVSGVIFGLCHRVNGGIYLLTPVIVNISLFGMLLGWLTLKTKNLIWPILIHMGINVIAVFS